MQKYSLDKVKKQEEKRKLAEKRENRKARAALNEKSLPHQRELTQKALNAMIRLLDAGKSCPTCDKPLIDGEYDAGHVRSVASCPELRFDPRNIFGQCRSCNGSGTIRKRTRKPQEVVSELYKQWVLREKGHEYYDWLYGPHGAKHYSCDDLKEMRSVFLEEARRLKKGLSPRMDWRGIYGV